MFRAYCFTTTYTVISHIQKINPQVLKKEKDGEKNIGTSWKKSLLLDFKTFTYESYIFTL